jgi:hypothetical protein
MARVSISEAARLKVSRPTIYKLINSEVKLHLCCKARECKKVDTSELLVSLVP